MKFFFDNNLSPKTAKALAALDYDVIHLRDEFPGDTPDEEWMPSCARKGWVAISHDRNIQAKPHLRETLEACGLVIFFMPKSMNSLDPREMMIALLKAWPNIEAAAATARAGRRWFVVRLNGKVESVT